MTLDSAPINLTHHFLIAMPGLEDMAFSRSVVYLCEHTQRGALGLIINKPTDITLGDLFDKVDLSLGREDLRQAPVLLGGPLQTERGFVLHEPMRAQPIGGATAETANAEDAEDVEEADSAPAEESGYASTMQIPGSGLEMTTSRDVLEALSTGAGPRKVLVTLGYASWGEGQLESELGENAWLTVQADPAVIFDTPVDQRYDRALSLLGLQAWMLSSEAGHA